MLSPSLPTAPASTPENPPHAAAEVRGQPVRSTGFVAQMRGLLATRPISALSREEWEDVRRKLAPCRPSQPPRRFGPVAGLPC